jgi:hypothetical protein
MEGTGKGTGKAKRGSEIKRRRGRTWVSAGFDDSRRSEAPGGCAARSSFLIYFNKLTESALCAFGRIGPLALRI